eukprot:m.381855 g.381855  ORF g.381855 m.381855 type:complete len:2205 (+) comp28252_c0_seq9:48-6662(+)
MAGESKPDDGSADTVLTDVASLLIEELFNVGALTEANDMINNMKRVVVDRAPNTTLGIKVGLLADQVGVRVSGMHPDSILTGRLNIDDVIIAVNGELMLRSPTATVEQKIASSGSQLDFVIIEAQYVSCTVSSALTTIASPPSVDEPEPRMHVAAEESGVGAEDAAHGGDTVSIEMSLLLHPDTRDVVVIKGPNQQLGLMLETMPEGVPGTHVTAVLPNGVVDRTCKGQVREDDVIVGINGVPMMYLMHSDVRQHLANGATAPNGLRLSVLQKDCVRRQLATASPNQAAPPTDSWPTPDSGMPLSAQDAMSHEDARVVTIVHEEGSRLGMRLVANPGGKRGTRISVIHAGGLVHRQAAGKVLFGDVIVAINGDPMLDMDYAFVRQRIQDAKEDLTLTLLHEVTVDQHEPPVTPPERSGIRYHPSARDLSVFTEVDEKLGLSLRTGQHGKRGARVTGIQNDGAVARAYPQGLQIGDVIVAINDDVVLDTTHEDIISALTQAADSDGGLLLTVLNPRHLDIAAAVLGHPQVRHLTIKKVKGKKLGLSLQPHPEKRGSRVTKMKRKGTLNSQHKGKVEPGDVVVGINNEAVLYHDHDDVVKTLDRAVDGEYITLSVVNAAALEKHGYMAETMMSPIADDMDERHSSGTDTYQHALSVKHVNATAKPGQQLGLAIRTEPDLDHPSLSIHTVHALLPGSSAYESRQIEKKDVVVAVNGRSVVHMGHKVMIELMRRSAETDLRLTLIPVAQLDSCIEDGDLKPGVLIDQSPRKNSARKSSELIPSSQVRSAMLGFEECYNDGDLAGCSALYASSCLLEVNGGADAGGYTARSRDEVKEFYRQLHLDAAGINMVLKVGGVNGAQHTDSWSVDTGAGSSTRTWVLEDEEWKISKDETTFEANEETATNGTAADVRTSTVRPFSVGSPASPASATSRRSSGAQEAAAADAHTSAVRPFSADSSTSTKSTPGVALEHTAAVETTSFSSPTQQRIREQESDEAGRNAEGCEEEDVAQNVISAEGPNQAESDFADEPSDGQTDKAVSQLDTPLAESGPVTDRGTRKVTLDRSQGPLGLKLIADENHRGARVLAVESDSQAGRSGQVFPGDRIQEINGVRLATLPHRKIYGLLGDGLVELEVAHDDAPLLQSVDEQNESVDEETPAVAIAEVTIVKQRSTPLGLHFYALMQTSAVRIRNVSKSTVAVTEEGVLRDHDSILSINDRDVQHSTPAEVARLLDEIDGTAVIRVMRHTEPAGMPCTIVHAMNDGQPGFSIVDGDSLGGNAHGRRGLFVGPPTGSAEVDSTDLENGDRVLAINGVSVALATVEEADAILEKATGETPDELFVEVVKAADERNTDFWSTVCSQGRNVDARTGPDGDLGLRVYSDENDIVSTRVLHVEPDGPACTAGIKAGDVLLSVDEGLVVSQSHEDVVELLRNVNPNESIQLGFAQPPKPTHQSNTLEKEFTLQGGPNGGEHGIEVDHDARGFVVVSDIAPGSGADRLAKIGELKMGDVLLAVNDMDVLSAGLGSTRDVLATATTVSITVMAADAHIFDSSKSVNDPSVATVDTNAADLIDGEGGMGSSRVDGDESVVASDTRGHSVDENRDAGGGDAGLDVNEDGDTTPQGSRDEDDDNTAPANPLRAGTRPSAASPGSVNIDGTGGRPGGYSTDTSGNITFSESEHVASSVGTPGGAMFSTDGEFTSAGPVETDDNEHALSPRVGDLRKRISAEKTRKSALSTGDDPDAAANKPSRFGTYSVGSSSPDKATSPLKIAAERAAARHRKLSETDTESYSGLNRIQLLRVCHERGISVPDEIHNNADEIRNLIREVDMRATTPNVVHVSSSKKQGGTQSHKSGPIVLMSPDAASPPHASGVSPFPGFASSPDSVFQDDPSQDDRFRVGIPTNVTVTSPGPSPTKGIDRSPASAGAGLDGEFDEKNDTETTSSNDLRDGAFTKMSVQDAVSHFGYETEMHTVTVYKNTGPGASLGMEIYSDANIDGVMVGAIDPGSPSETAGVLPQDHIVEIDGVDVSERETKDVIAAFSKTSSSFEMVISRVVGKSAPPSPSRQSVGPSHLSNMSSRNHSFAPSPDTAALSPTRTGVGPLSSNPVGGVGPGADAVATPLESPRSADKSKLPRYAGSRIPSSESKVPGRSGTTQASANASGSGKGARIRTPIRGNRSNARVVASPRSASKPSTSKTPKSKKKKPPTTGVMWKF